MTCALNLILLLLISFQSASSLASKFEKIAAAAQGRVGSAVLLLETGETAGLRLDEKFPMQSVFKLPIAMSILRGVDQGKLALEQKIFIKKSDLLPPGSYSRIRDEHPEGNFEITLRDLLRAMMDVSDGTACDVLLRLAGGPGSVTAYIRAAGVKEMEVGASQAAMTRTPRLRDQNWASPRGMLELLCVLYEGRSLSRANRGLLLKLMAESKTGPKRIKGLLPPGTVVSHKTGTSGTASGVTFAINDVGIVTLPDGRHLAIAVFVANSRAGEAGCERVIAETARAAWDHYLHK